MLKKLILLSLTLFLAGCATTRVSSFKDPSFANLKLDQVLISAAPADLETRTTIEMGFVEHFARSNVKATPSLQVFMPTRAYTDKDFQKTLEEKGVSIILWLELVSDAPKQTYSPGMAFTTGQINSPRAYSNSPNVLIVPGPQTYSSQSFSVPGGMILRPRRKYNIYLIDLKTQKLIWAATSTTEGHPQATPEILAGSLAQSVVEKLKEDGLIK